MSTTSIGTLQATVDAQETRIATVEAEKTICLRKLADHQEQIEALRDEAFRLRARMTRQTAAQRRKDLLKAG